MNAVVKTSLYKRQALAEWLETLGSQFDLTDTEMHQARDRYRAVGRWLAESSHPWMAGAEISVHGSIALGTVNRPIGRDEFDADALSHLPAVPSGTAPATVKLLIGTRLREHGIYKDLLEELPRCWRLNYANEFHLDVTPSIPHPFESEPALIVPDKRLQRWTPSNPHGFRQRFVARAELAPRFASGIFAKDARAIVGEFPMLSGPKGILRRAVQLLKRHRDVMFQDPSTCDLRPISIIITTLAAYSYEREITSHVFETDYDVLLAIVAGMPSFIGMEHVGLKPYYRLNNETVSGENFAEKWNQNPRLAQAFFRWHAAAMKDLQSLAALEGLDELAKLSGRYFGERISRCTLDSLTQRTERSRLSRTLGVVPMVGLATSRAGAVPVPRNTFFGRP